MTTENKMKVDINKMAQQFKDEPETPCDIGGEFDRLSFYSSLSAGSTIGRSRDKLLFERLVEITGNNKELAAWLYDVATKVQENENLIRQMMPEIN